MKSDDTSADPSQDDDNNLPSEQATLFTVFNEIGIIHQLASTAFNRTLPDGLYVSHFSVINHLMRLGDGKTPLAISRAFQVSKGTMSNTLNGLSKRNFVAFKPHETDGRSKLVWLNDEGREFHAAAVASLSDIFSGVAEELDVDRLMQILPSLIELREVMDRRRDQ